VAILSAIQPLLGAVLMLCVSLVQGAATTLGMIFNRTNRDWHTDDAHEDLPQATSGIYLKRDPATGKPPVQRIPREGGDPVLRAAQTHTHRSALTRADQTPACAGGTEDGIVHRHAAPPYLSFWTRAQRASRNPGSQAPPRAASGILLSRE
jgi:hypothetical protein